MPRLIFGLTVVTVLALATCSHPTTGLLATDDPYTLRTINGQLLPYAVNGSATGPQISAGSLTFFKDHSVQRFQQGRRPSGSTMTDTRWTQPGTFYTQLGKVIISYQSWPTPQGGPMRSTDTLVAIKPGVYVLHEGGMKLIFCRESASC